MNFLSDNVYGVHPAILEAIVRANTGLTNDAFCNDAGTRRAEVRLREIFECDLRMFFALNGTGANNIALSAMTPPHGAILCHQSSHLNLDECNCTALFTGGSKPLALPGSGYKITPEVVRVALAPSVHQVHGPVPTVLSVTQATELGTVYTTDELAALCSVARKKRIKVHMDGARLANAIVHLGCAPAETTWKAGVDTLYLGGSKTGALNLECVIFFDTGLAERFEWRRKNAAQLLSKGWFLSAQLEAYLANDLWLDNALQANAIAQAIAAGISERADVRLAAPVQSNEVFFILDRQLARHLSNGGARFLEWPMGGLKPAEVCIRLVTSYATPEADVQALLGLFGTYPPHAAVP